MNSCSVDLKKNPKLHPTILTMFVCNSLHLSNLLETASAGVDACLELVNCLRIEDSVKRVT